ncbi:MAG: mannose-1-phosphate guanylyltransferase/mannose-6-phosphate isomerase, partial [Deltaproteobacteria bacterium]|nr:mannose-1-phosphate guanylyltransferase/mannose-6-phosphate isomerase [Deltaproteobacteria bacterium]
EKVKLHLPGLYTAVDDLFQAESDHAGPETSMRLWSEMPNISVDFGVMEKAEGIVVIPASFGWSDVGTWRALTAFPSDDAENFVHGKVITVDSAGNVLYSSHGLLAALGLENMVVVVTRGAVLVCPADRTQEVRALVDELKSRNMTEYL